MITRIVFAVVALIVSNLAGVSWAERFDDLTEGYGVMYQDPESAQGVQALWDEGKTLDAVQKAAQEADAENAAKHVPAQKTSAVAGLSPRTVREQN
jgi:hypothetical protein